MRDQLSGRPGSRHLAECDWFAMAQFMDTLDSARLVEAVPLRAAVLGR
jgi:hypothetical protein